MSESTARAVEQEIRRFLATSTENRLRPGAEERAWDEPLVGFSRGDDPLYVQLQADIGPFYWSPLQAYRLGRPGEEGAEAGQLAVISWVLPQTEATRQEQRRETRVPGERWARARDAGEECNDALRRHLVAWLEGQGVGAVAPALLPEFGYRQSPRFGLASNWSERHAAHAAGLGTFGLSDGLITPRGKAVRCGSVVARCDLPAAARPYPDHQAWCLWYAKGSCGVCAERCPAGAIGEGGHDKERCFAYIREVAAPHAQQTYGTRFTPCGLCQVGIPCEARIPAGLADKS